jgi:hypothetical protein
VSEDRCVNRVGLCEPSCGSGKRSHLTRIDDCHSDAGSGQVGSEHGLESGGRLKHDEIRVSLAQPIDKPSNAGLRVWLLGHFTARANVQVQCRLADVDADPDTARLGHSNPSIFGAKLNLADASYELRRLFEFLTETRTAISAIPRSLATL